MLLAVSFCMLVNVKTQNVSLAPEIEAFIDGLFASGRFRSASKLVPALLRLLEEDEHRQEAPNERAGRLDHPGHPLGWQKP